MKALLLIIACCLTVNAQSTKEGKEITEWEDVFTGRTAETGATARYYWSRKTIRRDGDVIKVWLKIDFPSGAEITNYEGKRIKGIASAREFVIIDCAKRIASGDTEILYFMDGRLKSRENFSKNVARELSRPDSFSYFISNYFCERGKEPTGELPTLKRPSTP